MYASSEVKEYFQNGRYEFFSNGRRCAFRAKRYLPSCTCHISPGLLRTLDFNKTSQDWNIFVGSTSNISSCTGKPLKNFWIRCYREFCKSEERVSLHHLVRGQGFQKSWLYPLSCEWYCQCLCWHNYRYSFQIRWGYLMIPSRTGIQGLRRGSGISSWNCKEFSGKCRPVATLK